MLTHKKYTAVVLILVAGLAMACSDDATITPADSAVADATSPDAGLPDATLADHGPDAFVPFSMHLTVNDVPAAMTGRTPYKANDGSSKTFLLHVPTYGFTVDVTWAGTMAKPSALKVTCDRDLGTFKAGQDLASRFTRTPGKATLLLPKEMAAPPGQVTFTANMVEGATPRSSGLKVMARERTYKEDPFRLLDTWVVVFGRDLYTVTSGKDSAGWWSVSGSEAKNGLVDFEEDLRVAGLSTPAMLSAAAKLKSGKDTGTNAIMRAWMEREVLGAARKAFGLTSDGTASAGSVNIRLLSDSDPAAPDFKTFKQQTLTGAETSRPFSCISVGGGNPSLPYLGRASGGDVGNLRNEANLAPSRGVFTGSAIAFIARTAGKDATLKMLLRQLLGDFVPELGSGGKRVGEHSLDATILASGFDPKTASSSARSRYDKLKFLVQTIGRLAGALTAHEIGHSLGLVPNGAPPYGLFGGEKNAVFTNGARTTSHHIDTPGFNLMEAGPGSAPGAKLDIMTYLTVPRFNALNMAYLRGRLLVLKK